MNPPLPVTPVASGVSAKIVASAVINTALAAIKAYQAMSAIPIVGPFLGIAAAALGAASAARGPLGAGRLVEGVRHRELHRLHRGGHVRAV
jgi:hypothetical protein